MRKITRIAASTVVMGAGFGLVGLGAAAIAEAQPAPLPDYHWCPGDNWDPGWGDNWDWGRCHDDGFYDGEPRDGDHWHGQGPWQGDRGPGGFDRDHPGGWDRDHPGGPGGWGR